jgi:hypothetical protein
MADGYLEKHQADYEARREAFMQKKLHGGKKKGARRTPSIRRPDDEAL